MLRRHYDTTLITTVDMFPSICFGQWFRKLLLLTKRHYSQWSTPGDQQYLAPEFNVRRRSRGRPAWHNAESVSKLWRLSCNCVPFIDPDPPIRNMCRTERGFWHGFGAWDEITFWGAHVSWPRDSGTLGATQHMDWPGYGCVDTWVGWYTGLLVTKRYDFLWQDLRSLVAARNVFSSVRSLWNLIGGSATLGSLPNRLSSFTLWNLTGGSCSDFNTKSHGIKISWDLAYEKKPCRLDPRDCSCLGSTVWDSHFISELLSTWLSTMIFPATYGSFTNKNNQIKCGCRHVFYPRPVLAFGYCRCLRLSVCVSVRASITSLSAR